MSHAFSLCEVTTVHIRQIKGKPIQEKHERKVSDEVVSLKMA